MARSKRYNRLYVALIVTASEMIWIAIVVLNILYEDVDWFSRLGTVISGAMLMVFSYWTVKTWRACIQPKP